MGSTHVRQQATEGAGRSKEQARRPVERAEVLVPEAAAPGVGTTDVHALMAAGGNQGMLGLERGEAERGPVLVAERSRSPAVQEGQPRREQMRRGPVMEAERSRSRAPQEGHPRRQAPEGPAPEEGPASSGGAVPAWLAAAYRASGVSAASLGGESHDAVLAAAEEAAVRAAIDSVPADADSAPVASDREESEGQTGQLGQEAVEGSDAPSPEVHARGRRRGGRTYAMWRNRLEWAEPAPGGSAGIAPGAAPGAQRGDEPTMVDLFRSNRDARLAQIFGGEVSALQVLQAIAVARALDHGGVTEALQAHLAQANQYAIVDSLNVEGSERYRPREASEPGGRETFCNAYAYDVVTALGGYLPMVWWNPRALRRIRGGAEVVTPERWRGTPRYLRQNMITPIPSQTVAPQNANQMNTWLHTYGEGYGWTQVEGDSDDAIARQAQELANQGRVVICSAAGASPPRRSQITGHISVVLAESAAADRAEGTTGPDDGRPTHTGANVQVGHRHREAEDGTYNVLESNAGSANFAYGARRSGSTPGAEGRGSTPWWRNAQHARGGFWVYDESRRNSPIPAPGLGAP